MEAPSVNHTWLPGCWIWQQNRYAWWPGYGHDDFADYFGSHDATSGLSPWFSFSSSRTGYDPFYADQPGDHRNDRQWNQRVETEFAYLRDHDGVSPRWQMDTCPPPGTQTRFYE